MGLPLALHSAVSDDDKRRCEIWRTPRSIGFTKAKVICSFGARGALIAHPDRLPVAIRIKRTEVN